MHVIYDINFPVPSLHQYENIFFIINITQALHYLWFSGALNLTPEWKICFTVGCNRLRINSSLDCYQIHVHLLLLNLAKVDSSEKMTCCQNIQSYLDIAVPHALFFLIDCSEQRFVSSSPPIISLLIKICNSSTVIYI